MHYCLLPFPGAFRVRERWEAEQQDLYDTTQLHRCEEIQRHARVGPAGGVWGCKPPESLRNELNIGLVMSAAGSPNKIRVEDSYSDSTDTSPSPDQEASKLKSQLDDAGSIAYYETGILSGSTTICYSNMLSTGDFQGRLPPLSIPSRTVPRMHI